MAKTTNMPEMRFEGFTNPRDQRKLGNPLKNPKKTMYCKMFAEERL